MQRAAIALLVVPLAFGLAGRATPNPPAPHEQCVNEVARELLGDEVDAPDDEFEVILQSAVATCSELRMEDPAVRRDLWPRDRSFDLHRLS